MSYTHSVKSTHNRNSSEVSPEWKLNIYLPFHANLLIFLAKYTASVPLQLHVNKTIKTKNTPYNQVLT